MGNRAVITNLGNEKGIYIHWNGGRDTVEPVLWYCKNLMPKTIVAKSELERIACALEFMGLSPEIDDIDRLDCDNWDNGVYVVKDCEIVGRLYQHNGEQKNYNFISIVMWANKSMPKIWQKSEEDVLKTMALELPEYCNWDGKTDFDLFMKNQDIDDIVLYDGVLQKIIGRNNTDKPVNGSVRKGELFFNYTTSLSKHYKIPDTDIETLMQNPNSYFRGIHGGVIDVKIVDMEKYKKLSEEWKRLKEEARD